MIKRRHVLALPACGMFPARAARAASAMDPELQRRTRRPIAMGLHYLRGQQAPDGSMINSVGITALALRAFLESQENYNESDGGWANRDSWWEDRPQLVTAWSVIALEQALK